MFLHFLFVFVSAFAGADTVIQLKATDSIFGGGKMTVPCRPESIDTQCTIDTGSNFSTFTKESFSQLPPSIGKASYKSAIGSQVQCDVINLDTLTFGELKAPHLEPIVCPSTEGASFSNLIGLDFFGESSFQVDAPNNQLIILDDSPSLPLSFEKDSSGHILLPAQSSWKNPINTLAMFDTGASMTVIDIELVNEQPDNFTVLQELSTVTDSHGNKIKNLLVLGSVVVGGQKFVAEYLVAMDFSAMKEQTGKDVRMILGYNIIKQNSWTFNLANSTWDIK